MALAGVVQYAVYLAHRFYREDLSRDQLSRLAAFLISETATQDPKVGGPIHIATLSVDDGYQELSPEDVASVNDGNAELTKSMRDFFAKGA